MNKKEEELNSLMDNFEKQEAEMLARHEKELNDFKEEYEKTINDTELNESMRNRMLKPSSELLNWMKIKETAIKQKKYEKAQEAAVKIEELAEKEIEKYNNEKQRKYKIELQKIMKRQDTEKKAFDMKKESVLVSFNKAKVFSSRDKLVQIRPQIAITPPKIDTREITVKIKSNTLQIAFRLLIDSKAEVI